MKKVCSKCGEVKPLTEYSRDKRRKDGRRANCKKCQAEQDRQYRERKKSMSNSADNADWQKEKKILYAQLNGVQRQLALEREEWERERKALKQARKDFEGRIRRLREQMTQLEIQRDMWQRRAHQAEANKWSFNFGGDDNGLKVFAAFVGLPETASAAEIKRAFRKAKAEAHPDNTEGREQVSARYNSAYDLFMQLYK